MLGEATKLERGLIWKFDRWTKFKTQEGQLWVTFKSRLVVPGKLRLTILKRFIFNTSVLIFGVFVLFGFFQPSLCVRTEHYQVTVFFFLYPLVRNKTAFRDQSNAVTVQKSWTCKIRACWNSICYDVMLVKTGLSSSLPAPSHTAERWANGWLQQKILQQITYTKKTNL